MSSRVRHVAYREVSPRSLAMHPNNSGGRRPDFLSSADWRAPVANSEYPFHQLAPYIGKLKSSIAADLVRLFTKPGDLVVDPFCGAGTIALEAGIAGRRVFASDISPYAELLTQAKLSGTGGLAAAIAEVEDLLAAAGRRRVPDLRTVPEWVRSYFHPQTLKEAIALSEVCKQQRRAFLFACLLGILHHQRPGFLSYPSSHLVPYLREKKFPRELFPSLYAYRPLRPRLLSKVLRAHRRWTPIVGGSPEVVRAAIEEVVLPRGVDAIITSPPYMNALDYGRDNRLRLWFVDPGAAAIIDAATPSTIATFAQLMRVLVEKAHGALRKGGNCALVIGDAVSRSVYAHPARVALDIFTSGSFAFRTVTVIDDLIPDIRRARRDCRGVKLERVVVFQKIK